MNTPQEPTEEQIRAYEEELSRVSSAQIVVQAAASLLSIGGHRLGLGEGREQQRDLDQVCDAIDGVKALMPIVERRLAPLEARQLREALSQLQMGYARLVQAGEQAGAPAGAKTGNTEQAAAPAHQPAAGAGDQGAAGEQSSGRPQQDDSQQGRGPAEASGRLWVPGR